MRLKQVSRHWLWNSFGGRNRHELSSTDLLQGSKLFLLFCYGCHIFNTLLLTAQYFLFMSSVFFSLAALKVFFLYLVFRSLNVFKGNFLIFTLFQGHRVYCICGFQLFNNKKKLGHSLFKIFLLSHSVSSPSGTLDDILPNCLTLLHRLRMFCPIFFFRLPKLHLR